MLFSHAKCSFLQYRIFDANDVAADFIFFFHSPFFALSFTACSNSSQILYANYISFSALNRCEPHTGGIIAFYVWYEGLWMEYFNSNSHFIYMKEIVILCCVQCFISFYTNWTQYKHQKIHWMQWLIFIRMKLSTISSQIFLTLNSIRSVFFLNHRTVSWLRGDSLNSVLSCRNVWETDDWSKINKYRKQWIRWRWIAEMINLEPVIFVWMPLQYRSYCGINTGLA